MPHPHHTREVVLGIDVGTTAAKVSAFGLGDEVGWRCTAFREYPLQQPQPGWEVQDSAVVMEAVLVSLAECVESCGGATAVAIGLSTAMHGLVGLDADQRPLTPLVTWADSRAAGVADELRRQGLASALASRSGTPLHSMSPLTKLIWFTRHDPEVSARVRHWVGLKDVLIATLTGTLATERSCASGTGLLDLASGQWSPASADLAGISIDQLPPILATTASLPLSSHVAARVGLPSGIPVIVGAGDGPLGNLGVGALDPGVAGLSLGTSGALRMVTDAPLLNNSGSLFCYALTDDAWVVGGAVSNGGVVGRWAADMFAGPEGASDEALMELAASVPAGSDGLVMIPYLMGERAPLWDPTIPGAYLGVRRMHTPAHFARAALEGVGMTLATVLDGLDAVHPVDEVRATGGVFRAQLWRDIVAACLDRPLVLAGGAEGTGLGASALALLATGRAASLRGALHLLGADPAQVSGERAGDADVAVYRESRRRIAELVSAYGPLASAMTPRDAKA